jgi:hypothetical protein
MSGYNPNASMLPASGGNIVAMSGGGVAKQHSLPLSSKDVRQQGSGAGLVFANGGSRKKRTLRQSQSGGVPAHLVPQSKSSATGTPPASTASTASSTASTASTASSTASSAPVPGSITTVSVTTSSTPTPDPKLTPAPATTSATTPTPTPTPTPLPVPSDPNNIDDILIKLIGSLPKTKDTYTNEEQDSLLKNLTLLLNSDTNKKFTIEIK